MLFWIVFLAFVAIFVYLVWNYGWNGAISAIVGFFAALAAWFGGVFDTFKGWFG